MFHSVINGQHAFELSVEEMRELAFDAVKNGAKVTWSLDTLDVEFNNPCFGWSLTYDQAEGLYFLSMADDSQAYLEYLAESLDKMCQDAA